MMRSEIDEVNEIIEIEVDLGGDGNRGSGKNFAMGRRARLLIKSAERERK
jgi:hypothetical protein